MPPRASYGISYGDINMEDNHDPDAGGPPEDSLYAGKNPELYAAMRKSAVAHALGGGDSADDYDSVMSGAPAVSPSPAGASGPITLPGRGVIFKNPELLTTNEMSDLSGRLGPGRSGHANFKGQEYVIGNTRTVSPGLARTTLDTIARQKAQNAASDEADRVKMAAIDAATKKLRGEMDTDELASIQAQREINNRGGYDPVSDARKRAYMQEKDQQNLSDLTHKTEIADATAHLSGGMSQREMADARMKQTLFLIEKLGAEGTPEAGAKAAELAAGLPTNTPELASAFGTYLKKKPQAAGSLADISKRGTDEATRFGALPTSTVADVESLLNRRDKIAEAIVSERPGVTPEDARAEAVSIIEAALANAPRNGANAAQIPYLMKRLRGG